MIDTLSRLATCAILLAAIQASAAERTLDRTERFPATPGTRVVVDAESLDVFVRAADVREVEVATELRISGVSESTADAWITRHTPELAGTPGKVAVSAHPGQGGFLGFGSLTARARIGIIAPAHTVPDVTTTGGAISVRGDFPGADPLMLRSATGDMELDGAATAIDIRTAGGDARIRVVRPLERLFARTSSGNVALSGGARQVHVDTASGDVWLDNLSGPAEIETSTGRITLRWDRLDRDATVTVRTSSGRVHVVLPEGVDVGGSVRTTVGTIRSDLPGTVNEAGNAVELSGVGPKLDIVSESGEIVLSRAVGWTDLDLK